MLQIPAMLSTLIVVIVQLLVEAEGFRPPTPRFVCVNETSCRQLPANAPSAIEADSFEICRMTCGEHGSLWPKPTGPVSLSKDTVAINIENIEFISQPSINDLWKMWTVFSLRLKKWYGEKERKPHGKHVTVSISLTRPFDTLQTMNTDEQYGLVIDGNCSSRTTAEDDAVQVNITAVTIFGARHALETLSQLIVYDEQRQEVRVMREASIKDRPRFEYRGLLLDVARHFYPVEAIKRLIEAMSYNKLNVLHLHLTDSQAFPIEITKWPNMSFFGAYGPRQVYTKADLDELYSYAYVRGVTILPEVDAPSHVHSGWRWGKDAGMGDLVLCHNDETNANCWAPCGHLNPANEDVYRILEDIYRQILTHFGTAFPSSNMFHLGGDEVDLSCWGNSPELTQWIQKQGLGLTTHDLMKVWAFFEYRAARALTSANGRVTPWTILWSSGLTDTGNLTRFLPEYKDRLIVEYWGKFDEPNVPKLLEENLKVIVANHDAWYLDCGSGQWVGEGPNWCSPYIDWRTMYNNRPYLGTNESWAITDPEQLSRIIGGEGCLWSETIDESNVESRAWPRAAAIAERLWSDPNHCWPEANARMMAHRDRLVQRGVRAAPLQPEWCSRHEGRCIADPDDFDSFKSTCSTYNRQ